jgi:hypothetical protein
MEALAGHVSLVPVDEVNMQGLSEDEKQNAYSRR